MKVQTKVTIEGKEHDVTIDLPDDRYMTREQHELRVKDTVKKRLGRHAAELLQDEDFVNRVLTSKGIDPKNPGKPGGKGDEAEVVTRVQGEIRTREVEPLKQQLAQATEKLTKTRRNQLVSELETALVGGGVDKGIARRLAEVEVTRDVFGYDDEHDSWAVRDGEGFAYAPNATAQRPYKGIADFAGDWLKDPNNKPFITSQSQKGPGMNPSNGGNPGSVKSRSDFKSDADKVKWIAENGREAFMALPEK